MYTYVIAPTARDAENAKAFGLIPTDARYLRDDQAARGIRDAKVYVVNWPSRWFAEGLNNATSNRFIELGRMVNYLKYCNVDFTTVTLP